MESKSSSTKILLRLYLDSLSLSPKVFLTTSGRFPENQFEKRTFTII